MDNQEGPRLRFADVAIGHEENGETSISTDGGRVPTTYLSGLDLSNFPET